MSKEKGREPREQRTKGEEEIRKIVKSHRVEKDKEEMRKRTSRKSNKKVFLFIWRRARPLR